MSAGCILTDNGNDLPVESYSKRPAAPDPTWEVDWKWEITTHTAVDNKYRSYLFGLFFWVGCPLRVVTPEGLYVGNILETNLGIVQFSGSELTLKCLAQDPDPTHPEAAKQAMIAVAEGATA
jgi:hypothetical protein